VLIAVKQGIVSNNIRLEDDNLEALYVEVKLYGKTYYIFTVYFASPSRAENYVSFYKLFKTHEHFQTNNVIIAGDFNLPLITGSAMIY
jgi:hypothetical protein